MNDSLLELGERERAKLRATIAEQELQVLNLSTQASGDPAAEH